jgi:uncharacterized protein
MTKSSIVIAPSDTTNLKPTPVLTDWVLAGEPETRSKLLARSRDKTSYTMVWDCTAGRFNWHYPSDETLVVLDGEAFVGTKEGEERRIGPGDGVFFPAGASATWRVSRYIRKVAFLRQTLPPPLGFGVRAWHLLLRTLGRGKGGL